jgi:hypothetical protein
VVVLLASLSRRRGLNSSSKRHCIVSFFWHNNMIKQYNYAGKQQKLRATFCRTGIRKSPIFAYFLLTPTPGPHLVQPGRLYTRYDFLCSDNSCSLRFVMDLFNRICCNVSKNIVYCIVSDQRSDQFSSIRRAVMRIERGASNRIYPSKARGVPSSNLYLLSIPLPRRAVLVDRHRGHCIRR